MEGTLCLLLGLLTLAGADPFLPSVARVDDIGNDQKTYNASFEGSADMKALWEYRFDVLFPKDVDQTSVSPDHTSASLTLTGFHEVVRLVLYENERDMTGSEVFFLAMSGEEPLPTIDVSLSSDVIQNNDILTVDVTVQQPDPPSNLDDFRVDAEFIGVDRSSGSPDIIKIPSFEHQTPVTTNKVSQEGNTYTYEVIPPNAEGLLFVRASLFANQGRQIHPGVKTVRVVKVVPEGSTDLFEDDYLGVKSNAYVTGELPCAKADIVPCVVECVTLGANVDDIELYAENGSLAYTWREDVRHGDNFIKSRFSFDDKTVGSKGELTCQASEGSRVVNATFDLIVFEHVSITSYGVEENGDQRIFRCAATGYPEPNMTIYVSDVANERIYDKVKYDTNYEDGEKIATYTYNLSDGVTMLNCQARTDYSFDFKKIDNPV